MTKKRMIVSLVCIVLALSMLVGAVLVVVMNRPEEPNGDVVGPVIESPNTPTPEQGGSVPPVPEEQPESETPPVVLPDFDEGNELLLDMNLIDHLAAMERGEPMTDEKGNYQLAMDGSIIYQGGDEDTVNDKEAHDCVSCLYRLGAVHVGRCGARGCDESPRGTQW